MGGINNSDCYADARPSGSYLLNKAGGIELVKLSFSCEVPHDGVSNTQT